MIEITDILKKSFEPDVNNANVELDSNNLDIETKTNINTELDSVIIYGFNGVGKTKLSRFFIANTKIQDLSDEDNKIKTSVYFNAYTEDLFYWINDNENDYSEPKLYFRKEGFLYNIKGLEPEKNLMTYLSNYNFDIQFEITYGEENEDGYFMFYFKDNDYVKISKGEERIFIWCIFLVFLYTNVLGDLVSNDNLIAKYIYIDDPITSLDDSNILTTVFLLKKLIDDAKAKNLKVIVSTHYGFLFNRLYWAIKKSNIKYKAFNLRLNNESLSLDEWDDNKAFYPHLALLGELSDEYEKYKKIHAHYLRQIIETVAAFTGKGYKSIFKEISEPFDETTRLILDRFINTYSHVDFYGFEINEHNPNNSKFIKECFEAISTKYF